MTADRSPGRSCRAPGRPREPGLWSQSSRRRPIRTLDRSVGQGMQAADVRPCENDMRKVKPVSSAFGCKTADCDQGRQSTVGRSRTRLCSAARRLSVDLDGNGTSCPPPTHGAWPVNDKRVVEMAGRNLDVAGSNGPQRTLTGRAQRATTEAENCYASSAARSMPGWPGEFDFIPARRLCAWPQPPARGWFRPC